MKLTDLTESQLHRLYRRIYDRYADCFGLDDRTLAIIKPEALQALKNVSEAITEKRVGFIQRGRK